jgi:2-oxoglutarate ferredoxin oxidoreductase subunit alpha
LAAVAELAKQARAILVVEMNSGQMFEDVRLAVSGRIPVEFYGRMGGTVPFPDEVLDEIRRVAREPLALDGDPRQSWMQRLKLVLN